MTDVLIPLAAAMLAAGAGMRGWRTGHQVIACLLWLVAACTVLVAVRTLPGPVVVGLLLGGLGIVAVQTAWPWLTRLRRSRSQTEERQR